MPKITLVEKSQSFSRRSNQINDDIISLRVDLEKRMDFKG